MSFQPAQFVGRPLTDLMTALRSLSSSELAQLRGGDISLHHANVNCPTIDADTCLPNDHPNVDIPGVVLEQFLGSGGQGCVFAGRIVATGKVVAVKVLAPSVGALRGVREALLTARVRHPHVLRVLRSQPVNGCWVVVMELVLGESLAVLPELRDISTFFHQVANAIMAVAAARLVHRDIKPANILVRRADGTPVLVDFGLAVDLGSTLEDIDEVSGTPFFLPPEAWLNSRPEPSWDAYALGVTIAVALGRPSDFPSDLSQLRRAKLTGDFDRSVNQILQTIEHPIADWACGLLQSNPADRLEVLRGASDRLAA